MRTVYHQYRRAIRTRKRARICQLRKVRILPDRTSKQLLLTRDISLTDQGIERGILNGRIAQEIGGCRPGNGSANVRGNPR